ncbi:MAG: hypothetical protein A4E24_00562 [Methanomethylovorans sp. PtaU1.Bin093]|uniref:hypothetical protein n=1 Tax=Methanomethylovorans sp. PtaU1.Bin093 TaxID=1811679 RepID=UPI0009CFB6A4|nr:hypothetical protein [Methanomethylovorans sp. PtaU1.Bin093]OPY21388.1 MAG: hypothetical protein A4E24_00562 [Methanomethylovorans sp. PtaU1.Bin093]
MACSAAMCMDNKEHASSVINHMGLSEKYTCALISWTEKYLDIGNLEKIIWGETVSSENPFRSVQVAAEKDLEFTVLLASKRDRSSTDVYFLEGNLLLLFNITLQSLKESSVSYAL